MSILENPTVRCIVTAVAAGASAVIVAELQDDADQEAHSPPRPHRNPWLPGRTYVTYLLGRPESDFFNRMRMEKSVFLHLCRTLIEDHGL